MYMGKTNSDIITVYQYLMLSTVLKQKKKKMVWFHWNFFRYQIIFSH